MWHIINLWEHISPNLCTFMLCTRQIQSHVSLQEWVELLTKKSPRGAQRPLHIVFVFYGVTFHVLVSDLEARKQQNTVIYLFLI